jgi:hypothetical protein
MASCKKSAHISQGQVCAMGHPVLNGICFAFVFMIQASRPIETSWAYCSLGDIAFTREQYSARSATIHAIDCSARRLTRLLYLIHPFRMQRPKIPDPGTSLNHSQNYATTDANGLLLNSLGDVLAFCVNSNPSTSTQCANLFTMATPTGFTAQDTIQAAWYIAQNPSNNVGALFNLASATPPFVGLTTAPTSFSAPVTTSRSACQTAVPLGASGNYAILAGSTVTNASTVPDQTTVTGGLVGVSPGTATTGFTAGTYVAVFDDTDAAAAQLALTTAYNDAAGLLSAAVLPIDMGGITFGPGLYATASAVTLNSGAVTLDAQGDPNAVFVFQIGSTFTAGVGTQVLLINGANAKNVFWQVGSSATINSNAAWAGNIIAYASISLGTDATLNGRAMAQNGAVTLLSNKITVPQ